MDDQSGEAGAVAALGRRDQVVHGALADARVRRGQIHQIRSVGEIRADAGLVDQALVFTDLLVGVLRVLPALRRRQKDLDALGPQSLGARDARGQPSRALDMST